MTPPILDHLALVLLFHFYQTASKQFYITQVLHNHQNYFLALECHELIDCSYLCRNSTGTQLYGNASIMSTYKHVPFIFKCFCDQQTSS